MFKRFGIMAVMMVAFLILIGCGRKPWWADPNSTWMKIYGGDVCGDVLLADDGGFFIVGNTYELGRGGDICLIRSDSAHQILWTKTYGGDGYDMGYSMIQTNDGCLAIAGQTSSTDAKGKDAYLIKVDQNGNELWSKMFGGPLDEVIFVVRQTADGGYILIGNIVDPHDIVADASAAGYGGYDGRSSIFLVKTDYEGNEVWSRVHDLKTNVINTRGLPTLDGGYLMMSTITYFPDSNDDTYLLRVDKEGNQVWSRTWKQGRIAGQDLIRTSDGNYLVSCLYSDPDDKNRLKGDHLFVKIDPEGNEIWRSSFGDPKMIDYGMVLTETKDGGYVAAGNYERNLTSRIEDISLVKLDKNGQLLWQKIIDTATHNMLATILQLPDRGYVIAGSTIAKDDRFDIFLIETDHEGNVCR